MATYGINISAAVSANGSIANGAGSNVYTCPANSYAEVQIALNWSSAFSGSADIKVDGKRMLRFESTAGNTQFYFPVVLIASGANQPAICTVKVGPGLILNILNNGGSSVDYTITGVVFTS